LDAALYRCRGSSSSPPPPAGPPPPGRQRPRHRPPVAGPRRAAASTQGSALCGFIWRVGTRGRPPRRHRGPKAAQGGGGCGDSSGARLATAAWGGPRV